MAKFMIEGGKELSGDIKVQGAKNAVLPLRFPKKFLKYFSKALDKGPLI